MVQAQSSRLDGLIELALALPRRWRPLPAGPEPRMTGGSDRCPSFAISPPGTCPPHQWSPCCPGPGGREMAVLWAQLEVRAFVLRTVRSSDRLVAGIRWLGLRCDEGSEQLIFHGPYMPHREGNVLGGSIVVGVVEPWTLDEWVPWRPSSWLAGSCAPRGSRLVPIHRLSAQDLSRRLVGRGEQQAVQQLPSTVRTSPAAILAGRPLRDLGRGGEAVMGSLGEQAFPPGWPPSTSRAAITLVMLAGTPSHRRSSHTGPRCTLSSSRTAWAQFMISILQGRGGPPAGNRAASTDNVRTSDRNVFFHWAILVYMVVIEDKWNRRVGRFQQYVNSFIIANAPTAPQAPGGEIWRICPDRKVGPAATMASSCLQAAGSWRDTAVRSRIPSPPPIPAAALPSSPPPAEHGREPPGQSAGGRGHRSEYRRPRGPGRLPGIGPAKAGGHRRLPGGARPLSVGGPADGGVRDR